MSPDSHPLDVLAPALPWEPDWPDILERAQLRPGQRRPGFAVPRGRLVLLLVLIAVIAAPLLAYGAANDWWFLGSGSPEPVSAPVIVKEGSWDGHAWQLIAYLSTTDGLCLAITPRGSALDGQAGAMACGPLVGVPRTAKTKRSPDMTITYLVGSATEELPAYIIRPVVAEARRVEVRFTDGHTLRLPTFAGPSSLGQVRFYASPLRAGAPLPGLTKSRSRPPVDKLAGLDNRGSVVACLVPATAVDGISPLSDCQ
jgi:hypothetical protein